MLPAARDGCDTCPMRHVDNRLLSYVERLELRERAEVDLVVIHCTELPDLEMAREYGQQIVHPASQSGNSGHWYIDRDGALARWVPEDRVAHHARGYNARSVGIELVNLGRYPDWLDSRRQAMTEPYPEAQVGALIALLEKLRADLPGLKFIAGHEDLDIEHVAASDDVGKRVKRKRDPGPLFPWARVVAACGLERML